MTEPRQRPADAPAPDAELDALRAEIDAADRAIRDQLNRRARLVQRVGECKRGSGRAVYDAARERDLVARLAQDNPGPFPDAALAPVYREIISGTRSLEAELRVAFLGPEGTFSHLAARQAFGATARFLPMANIPEVFAAVERGDAEHAVVPVENTSEGVVTRTLDSLVESPLTICGETLLRISLHLLSRSGRLEEVRRVASHPQPLAQCQGWLDRNLPDVQRVETASTVAAAELAARDPEVAALGGEYAAERAGLQVVSRCVEDRRDNTTRFLLLGGVPPEPSGEDRTSVVFTVRKHEPGALHQLLGPLARHGVNVTSIQSRPLKGAPWEYLFFIDLEGHRSDEALAAGLREAASLANSHRVLGSFPVAARLRRAEEG